MPKKLELQVTDDELKKDREYWESVILQKINALKISDSNDTGGQRTVFEFIA